jgi:hypothetical protein
MQDANPMCAFSGGRARSSVLGVRSSASDRLRCRVPGPRCQIAGTRYLAPVFEKPAHGVCMMQDKKGSDPGYLVPGTRYLAPMPNSHLSNLNKALLFCYDMMQDTGCMMQTRCARFPVAGLGLRCSVSGPRRRSGPGSQVPGTRDASGQSGNKAVGQ